MDNIRVVFRLSDQNNITLFEFPTIVLATRLSASVAPLSRMTSPGELKQSDVILVEGTEHHAGMAAAQARLGVTVVPILQITPACWISKPPKRLWETSCGRDSNRPRLKCDRCSERCRGIYRSGQREQCVFP